MGCSVNSVVNKRVTPQKHIRNKAERYLIKKSWKPQLVLYIGIPTQFMRLILVKTQEMGLTFYHTFSYAVVHLGDIPAQCIARIVGHDETILYERPSEVTPNTPSIQADFRASVDRMLDQDQQQKRLDLTGSCVHSMLQFPHTDQLTKELLQYKQQGTEIDTHSGVVQ